MILIKVSFSITKELKNCKPKNKQNLTEAAYTGFYSDPNRLRSTVEMSLTFIDIKNVAA